MLPGREPLPWEPPWDAGPPVLQRQRAGVTLHCSPRKVSFFFSFKNKYYFILFLSCRVVPEQACMATICGFPQPQAENGGQFLVAGAQQEDSEGQSQGGQAFSGSTRPGAARAWLRAAAPGKEPAPGSPVLVQRPHRLLFGTRNLREGGAGTQAFRKPEEKAPTVSPCSQPLAAGSTASCDKACTFDTSSSSPGLWRERTCRVPRPGQLL